MQAYQISSKELSCRNFRLVIIFSSVSWIFRAHLASNYAVARHWERSFAQGIVWSRKDLHLVFSVRDSHFFWLTSLDLWNRDADILWLEQKVTSLDGPTRVIQVLLDAHIDSNTDCHLGDEDLSQGWRRKIELLPLGVQHFSNIPIVQVGCNSGPYFMPSDDYAIPLNVLPSLEQIEAWASGVYKTSFENDILHPCLGFFRSAFVNFASAYHVSKNDLPQVRLSPFTLMGLDGSCLENIDWPAQKDLVRKAVRLTTLHGVWRRILVEDSTAVKQVSEAVHIQLATIITKGIMDLEIDILSALEKHVLGPKGPGKDNMLPIWTCLWLMILTYRETIDAWSDPQHEKKGLPQLARHMYDMLVTLYSALYRPSSPLRLNWLFDDIYKLFGRDSRLMLRMGTLKTEFTQFSQPTLLPSSHALLKKLQR